MPNQYTINKPIKLQGIEPFGGNLVDIEIAPAPINKGLIFRSEGRQVKACLENTRATMCTTAIQNKELKVLNSEHLLATLNPVYNISNAFINIKTHDSKSREFFKKLHIAKNTVVIPYFGNDLQKNVCDAIESIGVLNQEVKRPTIRLEKEIISSNEQLKLTPINGKDLIFNITTNYSVIGEQKLETIITPKTYKRNADARSYNKHIRSEKVKTRGPGKQIPRLLAKAVSEKIASSIVKYACYPYLGLNHGFSRDNSFIAPNTVEGWLDQQRMPKEICWHSIIDGLAKVALLPGKLIGVKIESKYASHKTYLKTLKENQHKFKFK